MFRVAKRLFSSKPYGAARLTPEVVKVIKATAPVVAPHANTITSVFYPKMISNNPEVLEFFNKTNQAGGRQASTLANAIVAYALNIDNLGALGPAVELMVHKHCALNVQPEHYPIVYKNLMEAVVEVLGDAVTPEVGHAWSESVLALAEILIDAEKDMYQKAANKEGGWFGWKEFTLIKRADLTSSIAEFAFQPSDGMLSNYAFLPGQYMTVKLPSHDGSLLAPRHYTITSSPGDDFLQCTVKNLQDGEVSGMMHTLKEGDKVNLGPPFGVFTMDESKPAVLISAGIGITPMKAFAEQAEKGKGTFLAVHVDESKECHVYKNIADKAYKSVNIYGHNYDAIMEEFADAVKVTKGKDCAHYICGPPTFMAATYRSLIKEVGVPSENVHYEVFGPQIELN